MTIKDLREIFEKAEKQKSVDENSDVLVAVFDEVCGSALIDIDTWCINGPVLQLNVQKS